MLTLVTPTDSPVLLYGKRQGEWTAEDWEALPQDDNIYEIIDGVLFMSTSPSSFHQWIIQTLYDMIGYPLKVSGRGVAFFAPIGLFLPNATPIQPDFVVVLAEHAGIIRNRHIYGVPDLVVEVVSPGSTAYDEAIKFDTYQKAGVPEYALVFPAKRELALHQMNADGEYALVGSFGVRDTVSFACAPDISFVVGKLFEGAPDTTL